jgi:hypothetical protein
MLQLWASNSDHPFILSNKCLKFQPISYSSFGDSQVHLFQSIEGGKCPTIDFYLT